MIKNPILSGFYPDPSICRVGDDFYLINSSFAFYPGIPVFHSTDLMHWEQIGYALDRPEQLPLSPDILSAGIFAPTIRFHDGIFYIICTNVCGQGNFIVTAERAEGPWSEVHWIEGAEGIDPSLFWDDDGTAYYTGTVELGSDPALWIAEIDLEQYRIVGEKKLIWSGALKDCHSPEGPHLYKKDGWYYLMIAEGGTEIHHAVTIARSRSVTGPYEGNPANPILTHRHLGWNYPICNVGHGDMVELPDGSWYMVVLGSRIYGGYHKNMGRETFLAPVEWENGWPVVSPGTGKVEWTYPSPHLPVSATAPISLRDDFDSPKRNLCWNTIGTPRPGVICTVDGHLRIRAIARSICPADGQKIDWMAANLRAEPLGFVGRRQQHMSFDVRTKLSLEFVTGKESAGLIVLQNSYQSIRAELRREQGRLRIEIVLGYIQKEFRFGTKSSEGDVGAKQINWTFQHNPGSGIYTQGVVSVTSWDSEEVILWLHANQQDYSLYAMDRSGKTTALAEHLDAGFLGAETAGGCIGAYIGMFASGNGTDSEACASFDWFEYLPVVNESN